MNWKGLSIESLFLNGGSNEISKFKVNLARKIHFFVSQFYDSEKNMSIFDSANRLSRNYFNSGAEFQRRGREGLRGISRINNNFSKTKINAEKVAWPISWKWGTALWRQINFRVLKLAFCVATLWKPFRRRARFKGQTFQPLFTRPWKYQTL